MQERFIRDKVMPKKPTWKEMDLKEIIAACFQTSYVDALFDSDNSYSEHLHNAGLLIMNEYLEGPEIKHCKDLDPDQITAGLVRYFFKLHAYDLDFDTRNLILNAIMYLQDKSWDEISNSALALKPAGTMI